MIARIASALVVWVVLCPPGMAAHPASQSARRELEETTARARALGDRRSQAYASVGQALLLDDARNPQLADAMFGQTELPQAADTDYRAALQLARRTPAGPLRRKLLDEALAAARQAGDDMGIARIQADIGDSLRMAGDFGGSIEILRLAIPRLDEGGESGDAGRAWLALSRSYFMHGQFAEAMSALERGEVLLRKTGDVAGVVIALQEAGTRLAGMGQRQKAAALLEQARHYIEDPQAPQAVRVRKAGLALGYIRLGEYQRAADTARSLMEESPRRVPPQAYWILSQAYFNLARYDDAVSAASAGIARSEDSGSLANLFAHRWRARSLDRLDRRDEAASDILEAVRLEESIRGKLLPDDESKRAFGDFQEPITDEAIAILWRAGRRADAWTVAEKSRARAFLELIARRDQSLSAPPSAEQLAQSAARTGETVLAYWIHPEAIYIWVADPRGKIHGARVEIAEARLQRLVERARSFSYKADRQAWRELDRLLIQPVRSWLPPPDGSLSLLPHASLLQLPFAALLDESGRYLAESYALRTALAAGFLIEPRARGNTSGPLLLVGAPHNMSVDASGKPLPPLQGASQELLAVAALSPGNHILLAAKAADENRVRAAAPGARVVHFATHAVIAPAKPFESFLALSDRGELTASEIYDLHLSADLVVLSACRSGSGQVSSDGLLGFTRAFLYAGAASVIAPLWDIPDGPTVRLVEEFYRQYRAGAVKTQALRAAQLKLLRDLRHGVVSASTPAGPMVLPEHPALWAGFVLQGAN